MHYSLRERVEYYTVKFFIFLTSILPKSFVYGFFKSLADIFFKIEKRRREITLKNLKLAFPQKNNKEIKELAIKSYESVSKSIAEIIMLFAGKITPDELIINKKEVLKKVEQYTKNRKNGVIFITAHFGNWEIAGQFLARNGYPMTIIGREGNNKLIEENITKPFRQKSGNKNVYKRNAMLSLVKTLKRDKNAGLLIDQKAGVNESVRVKFFEKEADTVNSVALLKLKFDPIILPVFSAREKNGNYKMIIYEPVELKFKENESEDDKIKKLTQKYNDIIEDVIKQYPEQWFWMHNRWRLK